jgi:hypothetical protein
MHASDIIGTNILQLGRKGVLSYFVSTEKMRGANLKWLTGIAVMLVVATLLLWLPLRRPTLVVPTSPGTARATALTKTSSGSGPAATMKTQLDGILHGALAGLEEAQYPAAKSRILAELRQALATGSTSEVSAAIRRFLDSKADASTGQGFKIGGHGTLKESPTLRTYLLDYLGQIDPAAAAEYAHVILNTKDSPDEWALALRNLAKGDTSPDAQTFLEQKTDELLRYQAWQQNPSEGYLEAFDTAVFVGGTNLVPALTDLVRRQDNPAVAHAAFLALDRLVINNTADVLAVLLAQPDLMQGREQTRADYFARADVQDPRQRELVEQYLLDPRISTPELQQFAGTFPNANYMVSENLLTPAPTPNSTSLADRDAASLRVIQQWLTNPQFAGARPQLEQLSVKLAGFIKQENAK